MVIGYFKGRGQRAAFGIGALLTAIYDKQNDRFLTIAKIGTGLSDEEWGHRVVAAVVMRGGARPNAEALLAFCRERLAPYKVPKELRFVANLPRNAAGKLLRRELRREWSGNPD